MRLSTLLSAVTLAHCREIVFPPVAGIPDRAPGQAPLRLASEDDDDVDLSTDAMGGLTSFGHLPFVPCFAAKPDEEVEAYDIAVLGAPCGLLPPPCLPRRHSLWEVWVSRCWNFS